MACIEFEFSCVHATREHYPSHTGKHIFNMYMCTLYMRATETYSCTTVIGSGSECRIYYMCLYAIFKHRLRAVRVSVWSTFLCNQLCARNLVCARILFLQVFFGESSIFFSVGPNSHTTVRSDRYSNRRDIYYMDAPNINQPVGRFVA